jgi:hypothetical protein
MSEVERACAPMECLDVTRMCEGERLEMRMMQPFDLSVSSYGADEYFGMLLHCVDPRERG